MTTAFVSTLLLLGIVGFSSGWVAAGSQMDGQVDPTATSQLPKPPTPSPTPVRTTTAPSPSRDLTPTGTPSHADQFEMPNLVNKKFQDARREAIAKKLGVNVVFGERALLKSDGTVVETKPPAGTFVRPGWTIQLHVVGPAPEVLVPAIIGMSCEEGKDAVLEAGLKISGYPRGSRGKVTNVEPAPGSTLSWNDPVAISCVE